MLSYSDKENHCVRIFGHNGPFWHLCTDENLPLLFETIDDFKWGMSIIALCALLTPEIKIITFTLMSNHLHVILTGDYAATLEFFNTIRKCMIHKKASLKSRLKEWIPYVVRIDTLENLRNAIAYVNRNGYVAYPEHTPFNYPWGAGYLMFNAELVAYHSETGKEISFRSKRELMTSHSADGLKGIKEVHGYVSPICFCDINLGESVFRDARHYYLKISKDVESLKDANVFFSSKPFCTDDELFIMTAKLAKRQYGCTIDNLSLDDKRKLAKKLHYDFHAGNKQIARILKIDLAAINALFPMSKIE